MRIARPPGPVKRIRRLRAFRNTQRLGEDRRVEGQGVAVERDRLLVAQQQAAGADLRGEGALRLLELHRVAAVPGARVPPAKGQGKAGWKPSA